MHPLQPVASGSNLLHCEGVGTAPKSAEEQRAAEKVTSNQIVSYEDTNRNAPSEAYRKLSVHYLRLAFPFLPKNIITSALYQHDDLYAPTYLHLHATEQRYTASTTSPLREERPYRCNATKHSPAADRRALAPVWDEAFGEEWRWVEARLERGSDAKEERARMRARHCALATDAAGASQVERSVQVAASPGPELVPTNAKGMQRALDMDADVNMGADIASVPEDPAEEEGEIECGCCFAEYTFDKMVQCLDGHLFCANCISQYAATQLAAHNHSLICMDASDCNLDFPESELRRVLTPKFMELYSRLVSQKAIAVAGLEGLEECPFCDWKCVIDVPFETESLFRCGNDEGGCGVVSCRKCKKKEHSPKTCEEMQQDQILNGQHTIEEAMTRALMRNCPNPKCNKAFIKEAGCNKMTCPYCRTSSCYVCRKMIRGYDHFGLGKCPPNDDVENRHANCKGYCGEGRRSY